MAVESLRGWRFTSRPSGCVIAPKSSTLAVYSEWPLARTYCRSLPYAT